MYFKIEDVRTRDDYNLLSEEDKVVFKGYLKGTINKQKDIAEYPSDYWNLRLKEGEEGYITPVLVDFKDTTIINSFGFSEEEL